MRNAASIRFNDKVRFKYNNIIMEGIIKDIEYNDFGIEVENEKDWILWILKI